MADPDTEAWQIAYIEEAVWQAEAGKFASEAEVVETFQRLRGPGAASGSAEAGKP